MDALVGARLEIVTPCRLTDTGDRLRLLVLLGLAVAVHGWVLTHTSVTARDGIGFARLALQLENPKLGQPGADADTVTRSIVDVFREAQHPPGYPIIVWMVSLPVRVFSSADLPDQMLLAARLASAIAGVLIVIPAYWLGRMLFSKWAGLATAAMLQCLPVFARVSSDGLTEGWYLLCLLTSVILAVRAVREPGVGGFLLCGLMTGITYLFRPEGLLVGVAVVVLILGLVWRGRWSCPESLSGITALMVGICVAATPYMLLIGGLTNKPTGDGLMKIRHWRTQLLGQAEKAGAADSVATGSYPLLASWYVPAEGGSRMLWAIGAFLKEGLKACHYTSAFLALAGIIFIRRRLLAEPWVAVPLYCLLVNVGVVMVLVGFKVDSAGRSYISERHMLPMAVIGMVYAAGFLEPLGSWLGRKLNLPAMTCSWLVLLGVCGSGLPAIAKPLHENRFGHVQAGRWLRQQLQASDTIVDPFEWAQYFAGRTLTEIPGDPPGSRVVYAVLEGEDGAPNSHLPRYQAAVNVARDHRARLVYHWPETASSTAAKVRVYRLELP
jgi:4-amino-4-deoxy-L-arabinose transferase-like glycosyltransferase